MQRDSQALLPPLEEMEKHITGFYQSLEKASRITSARESETPGDFQQKCQVIKVMGHKYCSMYCKVTYIYGPHKMSTSESEF